jgi:hypothetical protein
VSVTVVEGRIRKCLRRRVGFAAMKAFIMVPTPAMMSERKVFGI